MKHVVTQPNRMTCEQTHTNMQQIHISTNIEMVSISTHNSRL